MQNLHEQYYHKFEKNVHPTVVREEFVYVDGGLIHLDWVHCCNSPSEDEKPILIMIPGFNNDSADIYM